jgi:hypothetical protein
VSLCVLCGLFCSLVAVENYFNYFTEIEEHFQRRRGSGLLLNTLDWALIETWKDAGIPLAAVLRGIDEAFDRYDARPSKTRKVNSLAYCAQEVLSTAEEMKEAAAGGSASASASKEPKGDSGFENASVADFLVKNADLLARTSVPAIVQPLVAETAKNLREMAEALRKAPGTGLEDLERRLTVMEEKLMAALLASSSDDELVAIRAEADRELAPYRRRMPGAQIDQLQKQYVNKRLLERHKLPRLSLFYM